MMTGTSARQLVSFIEEHSTTTVDHADTAVAISEAAFGEALNWYRPRNG